MNTGMRPNAESIAIRLVLLLVLLGLCLAGRPTAAQTTSTIEGVVTDHQGLAIPGAEVSIAGNSLAVSKKTTANAAGAYEVAALPAGTYTLTISHAGFRTQVINDLEITLNRTIKIDVTLEVGTVQQKVEVSGQIPLLETSSSSEGTTIVPQQIEQMPINGRNYLDLLQLVPGVALNRQVDEKSDTATPILGERGGNAIFLIDGMPNSNQMDGGPAAPFDPDSILEFQVLTAGYKAEFGHGSGGVVNVLSKSGSSEWHGLVSAFHRNDALDSSNAGGAVPFLRRWDLGANLGGEIVKQ